MLKHSKLLALITFAALLTTLSGCSTVGPTIWGAAQNKFNDVMGINQIGEELAKVKTGAATGMKADQQQKDAVDLSGSSSSQASGSDETQTSEVPQSESGGTGGGGLLSKLLGLFGGSGSGSKLSNFYVEVYWGSKLLEDTYGYSPVLTEKIWYKDGKMKVTTFSFDLLDDSGSGDASGGVDKYYNASADAIFQELNPATTPERAEEIMSDSTYTKGDTVTINGFLCTEYQGALTSETEKIYVEDMSGSQLESHFEGGELYYIYTYEGTPIVMCWHLSGVGGAFTSNNGQYECNSFTQENEYYYTFNKVTDADVTPPDGTAATSLG